MALTSDNCLILWGSNSHGQIGNGTTSSIEAPYRIKFKKPLCKTEFKDKRIIDNPSKIISIACSSRNSYVLLENGDVYGWGENRTGQMGTVHVDNYVYPRLIYSRIKQFVAIRSYALALRKDGTLFGNGDNSFGQIEDYDGKQFYDKPFRFALKFEKFATWNNLSMGLTEDGRCFIWGEYGEVEFASVTRRIQIDKRKINQGTQVNLIEEQSENVKSNSVDKSNSVKSKQEEIEERTNEDLLVDKNCFNENKLEENNQHESIAAASNMSTNQGEINTDKEDEENTDKNLEKEKIREIINNGKIEKHKANLILKRPKEIKCKSFSKIIAKRFDSTYFTVKKSDNLSNDYRDDDENDLIDFSNLIIVITEYEEIVEQEVKPVAKMDDKKENDKKEKDEQSEQYKKIEERLERIEKKKSKTIKNYYGNKNKSVLFNKSTLSEVGDFKINDIHQTGTVGAGTTN
jgi:alpha-tubulin suppressor-like RCC1 family protein